MYRKRCTVTVLKQRIRLFGVGTLFAFFLLLWWSVFHKEFDVEYQTTSTSFSPHETTRIRLKDKTSTANVSAENVRKKISRKKSEIKYQECFLHKLSCQEPYLGRIFRINSACSNRRKRYRWKMTALKFNDNLKTIMCEVPKAASTIWQVLLSFLDGNLTGGSIEDMAERWNASKSNNSFYHISSRDARKKLRSYTSFIITRHPFERLVSAYLDKFTNRTDKHYYRANIGRPIAAKQAPEHMHGVDIGEYDQPNKLQYVQSLNSFKNLPSSHKKDVLKYVKVMNTGEISFHQFIRFIIQFYKKNMEKKDVHWMPQHLLCQPCSVKYSYIMKFENVMKDSNRLLSYIYEQNPHLLKDKKISFPRRKKFAANPTITQQYFKQISEEELRMLKKIYSDDFLFFDYDIHKYHGKEQNSLLPNKK